MITLKKMNKMNLKCFFHLFHLLQCNHGSKNVNEQFGTHMPGVSRSQALPGNACPAALPPIPMLRRQSLGTRKSVNYFSTNMKDAKKRK